MTWTERLAPVRAYWVERTSREQIMLASLAALLVLVIAWFLILAPAKAWRAEAERDFVRQAESYERVVVGLARYRDLSAGAAADANARAPLRTIIGRTATERDLAISRVQPLDDGRLSVWLDNVEADTLMAWLAALSRDDGVRIDRVSLDREGDGLVRAQLLLAGSGA